TVGSVGVTAGQEVTVGPAGGTHGAWRRRASASTSHRGGSTSKSRTSSKWIRPRKTQRECGWPCGVADLLDPPPNPVALGAISSGLAANQPATTTTMATMNQIRPAQPTTFVPANI